MLLKFGFGINDFHGNLLLDIDIQTQIEVDAIGFAFGELGDVQFLPWLRVLETSHDLLALYLNFGGHYFNFDLYKLMFNFDQQRDRQERARDATVLVETLTHRPP